MSDVKQSRLAVSAMFALNGLLFGAWASRIPAIQQKFDLNAGQLGLVLLCLAGGAIVSFPLAGRLSDQFGSHKTTICVAILYCPALALIGFAPTLPLLVLTLTMFGASHGFMDVAMNDWAAQVERHNGKPIMSFFHAMFSLGAGLGAACGSVAAYRLVSVPLHFAAFAAICPALLWFIRSQWHQERQPHPNSSIEIQSWLVIPKGILLLVALVGFGTAMSEGGVADWSAIYLHRVANADQSTAALGYAVFSLAMVFMRLFGDTIVHRTGPIQTIRLCTAISFVGSLLAVTSTSIIPIMLGLMLMGMGYSIVMPLVFSRAANDPHLKSGAAIAAVSLFTYGGLLLGPVIIGFIAEATSLTVAFGVFVLMSGLAFMSAGAFKPTTQIDARNKVEVN